LAVSADDLPERDDDGVLRVGMTRYTGVDGLDELGCRDNGIDRLMGSRGVAASPIYADVDFVAGRCRDARP
jgi:hypothetical protein